MNPADLQVHKQPATLRRLVEDKLRYAIASGHFKAGQRLIERELCEQLGVGRTSIREAIRQLEAEGLITTIPHRGPEVSSITYEEAKELYAFRALLESYAGEQVALVGTHQQMDQLLAAIDRFEEAATASDQRLLVQTKSHFYAVLLEAAGNRFVTQTLTTLHNRVTLLRVTSMNQPGRLVESVRELRDIHARIAARDGKGAAKACRLHIERAAQIALSVLKTGAP